MGESTRQHGAVELGQVGLAVPDQLDLATERGEGVCDVLLAVRAGEDHDSRPHPVTSTLKSSRTGLASTWRHISSTRLWTTAGSSPSTSRWITRSTLTDITSLLPRSWSARWIVVPWGSAISGRLVISTVTFIRPGPGSRRSSPL